MQDTRQITLESVGGLYSIRGAAERLGVSYDALDTRLRRSGNGVVVYRIGNERLVSLADLQRAGITFGAGAQ